MQRKNLKQLGFHICARTAVYMFFFTLDAKLALYFHGIYNIPFDCEWFLHISFLILCDHWSLYPTSTRLRWKLNGLGTDFSPM